MQRIVVAKKQKRVNSLKEVKTFWVNAGIIKGALAKIQVELINYVFL